MGNSIVVVRKDDRILTALFDGKELVTIGLESTEKEERVGDVFVGKVQNIVKNINGAFVEIGKKNMCFLPLEENGAPVFCDGKEHGIRVGDELLVQIVKEKKGSKAPLATVGLTLTGRLLVLVRGKANVGVSGKIVDANVRDELKSLVMPYVGDDFGFIVRTNAESAPEELLEREIARLVGDYRRIVDFGVHWNCFSKLYSTPPGYI